MMRANVITTRHVAGALAGEGCDWRHLAIELTDADRPIGELALSELVGAANLDDLRRHAVTSAQRLEDLAENGWEWLRTFLACSGSMREWFGVPWWPEHVALFVSQVTDPHCWLARHDTARATTLDEPPLTLTELATGLSSAPEQLSAEVLAWCVHDAHLGDPDHHAVKRQWRAAGSPRWAPPCLSEVP